MTQELTPQPLTRPFTQGALVSILLHAALLVALVGYGHSTLRREVPVGASRRWIALQLAPMAFARPAPIAASAKRASPSGPPAVAMHRVVHRPTPQRTELSHLGRPARAPSPNPIAYSSAAHAPPAAVAVAPALAPSANTPRAAVDSSPVKGPTRPEVTAPVDAAVSAAAGPPAGGNEMADMLPLFYRHEVSALIHFKLRPQGAVGTVVVRVHMRRDGTVLDAVVVQASGTPALDKEARDVVLRIHQFDWLPADAIPGVTEFCIDQPIVFAVQTRPVLPGFASRM